MSESLQVLFVEDTEDDMLLVVRALQRGGFAPVYQRVDTPAAFEAALAARPWDVIIADYFMPAFSAPDALAHVKARMLDIPFIVVSGSVGEERAVAAMKAGAHDYVMKDSLARLVPTIERELREATERRKRKQAEGALTTIEVHFAGILALAAEAIIAVDHVAGIVLFNQSAEQLFGYSAPEVLGRTLNFLLPSSTGLHIAGEQRQTTLGQRKDGTQFSAEIAISQLTQDERITTIVILHDTTEREQLESQVRQMQKMQSIGRLAGGVAHDFNNLLTAIMGYADLGQLHTPPDSELHSDLLEIRKAAQSAAVLTRQLLTFARQQAIEPRVFNLNDLMYDKHSMFRRLIGEDIEIVTMLAPDLGSVCADPNLIEQVIVNLIVNARDAMPHGGRLTLTTMNTTLDRAIAQSIDLRPRTYVALVVSDNGMGMSADVQQHMFEPFFTTKEPGKGTGLGLATCYGIVHQSDGHIACVSVPGSGTTFSVYLPYCAEQDNAMPRREESERLPHGHETVLVVEDEAPVRALIARVLRQNGYRVLEAQNGEAALALLHERVGQPIDLVLTDIIMPKMGGLMLIEHLNRIYQDIRVVFTSGYPNDAHGQAVTHGTKLSFLPKPFSPTDLVRVVRATLDA